VNIVSKDTGYHASERFQTLRKAGSLRLNDPNSRNAAYSKFFEQLDLNNDDCLTPVEFKKGITKIGINLTTNQVEDLFYLIDSDCDGLISKLELLAVIHPMSSARENKVNEIFQSLEDELEVEKEHLLKLNVTSEFQFTRFFEEFGEFVEKRGMGIDFDEIIAFYQMKSCEIEDDDDFMELLELNWKI